MNAPILPNLVSTIIPVFNRAEMVRTAVDSVLAQTWRPIEIILIDDGSTDSTGQVLDALAGAHPDIIRVIHKENGGPGLAREAGRLVARGEFIQYLDSDDWLLPDKFKEQVNALKMHADCGIAYGISRRVDSQGKVLAEPSKWTGKHFDYLFPALLIDRWWHTHTPLYRRSISDAAGAWPKQRPEDWDLEARMGALRTKLIYCDTVVSCHLEHPNSNRVSRGSQEAYLRDEAWFLPRLLDCAQRAGVEIKSPEMHHFSRWAFMRARYLGALGDSETAWKLIRLANSTAIERRASIIIVGGLARVFGWTSVGSLCASLDKLRHFNNQTPP